MFMKKQELLLEIQEALGTPKSLNDETRLADVDEFDSLGIIALINLYKKLFGVVIEGRTFNACKSVGELVGLVKERLEL